MHTPTLTRPWVRTTRRTCWGVRTNRSPRPSLPFIAFASIERSESSSFTALALNKLSSYSLPSPLRHKPASVLARLTHWHPAPPRDCFIFSPHMSRVTCDSAVALLTPRSPAPAPSCTTTTNWLRPTLEEIVAAYMKLCGQESHDSDTESCGTEGSEGTEEEIAGPM